MNLSIIKTGFLIWCRIKNLNLNMINPLDITVSLYIISDSRISYMTPWEMTQSSKMCNILQNKCLTNQWHLHTHRHTRTGCGQLQNKKDNINKNNVWTLVPDLNRSTLQRYFRFKQENLSRKLVLDTIKDFVSVIMVLNGLLLIMVELYPLSYQMINWSPNPNTS